MSDVTAVITFAREGLLTQASVDSYSRCCEVAKDNGIDVKMLALLDRPDPTTIEAVLAAKATFDQVERTDLGDRGATRNAGVAFSDARYVAFFNAGDLWGEEWIARAYRLAEVLVSDEAVLHPRVLSYFTSDDYRVQSLTAAPSQQAKSFHLIHADSREAGFDPRSLVFDEVWSSTAFGRRAIFARFPYVRMDQMMGFGAQDWTWNMETLVNGIQHVVVPDTVHCIRLEAVDGPKADRVGQGLIPPVHQYAPALDKLWGARRG